MLSVTNHTFKDAHNEHCTITTAQNAQFLFVQGKTSSSLRTSKKETSDKLSEKKMTQESLKTRTDLSGNKLHCLVQKSPHLTSKVVFYPEFSPNSPNLKGS